MPLEAKPLFRPDVLRTHLGAFALPLRVEAAAPKLRHWADLFTSRRADSFKEQELLPDFLTDFFCGLLGYTRPADGQPRYTLSREKHVEVDGKFADAVIRASLLASNHRPTEARSGSWRAGKPPSGFVPVGLLHFLCAWIPPTPIRRLAGPFVDDIMGCGFRGSGELTVKTAEIISFDGQQAVKLPPEFAVSASALSIRKDGEAIILEPIKAAQWPKGFFEAIRIDDPAFCRPPQGQMPPVPPLS